MNNVVKSTLVGILSVGLLAGCASETDSIVMSPVPTVKSQFTPEEVWSSSVGDGVDTYFSKLSPAYAYDKVFVASRDGIVKALDPKTGDTLWKVDLSGDVDARLSGGVSYGYGKIYIGTENGQVLALDQETGKEQWRVDVGGEVLARPATDENLVLVNVSNGTLVALDQNTGVKKWDISMDVPNLTLRGDSTPATVSGGVFWGTASGRLAAAIIARGQLIWQQPIGTPKGSTEIDRLVDVDASPIILGTHLYIVGYNGELTCIDLRSGKPMWKRAYSSAVDMASDGRNIYLVTAKDHLVAVDARSGTELWKNQSLQYRQLTAPVLVDGYIVVGDAEGYLYWLDRNSGDFVAKQEVDSSGFAVGPVALPDGYVITTRDGDVKKLKIK